MLKQHLNNYQGPSAEGHEGGGSTEKAARNEIINPKLRHFFDVKTKIEPFYNGGKVMMLSPCHFICQCGPVLKVVSTMILPPPTATAAAQSNSEPMDIDGDEVKDNDEKEKKDFLHSGSFGVIGQFETELDEILSFDACPTSYTLITAHRSHLLRIWDLNEKTVIKTIRSFHNLPIGFVEIQKFKYPTGKTNGISNGNTTIDAENEEEEEKPIINISDFSENLRNNLTWITMSGSSIKVWDFGGNLVSKSIKIENVPLLGLAKWDINQLPTKSTSANDNENVLSRFYVAESNIYVIEGKGNSTSKEYKITHTLEGHFSQVSGIEFSNNLLISSGRDKVIILWDKSNDFNKLKTIPFPNPIDGLVLLPNSNDLYVALNPSEVRHFNLEKNILTKKPSVLLHDETITSMNSPFSNFDTDSFLISTHNSTIYFVGQKIHSKKNNKNLEIRKQFVGSLDEILSLAIWTKDKVAVSTNSPIIKIYNLASGSCDFLNHHTDIVLSLSVHQNEWLVSTSKDNKVIIWSSTSNIPKFVLEGHMASVSAACFGLSSSTSSEEDSPPIVYSVSDDKFLKMWETNKCIKSVIAHEKEMHSVHCSPNGLLVLTSSRDKTAKLWDSKSLKLLGTFKGHKKSVWDAKFSEWDQLVVTGSADTFIKIWNLNTFECIQTLQGHLSSVLQVKFINQGLQVISSSSDGTFRSWDLRSSICISTMECSEENKIWALDSTSDGCTVVTGSADSILTIWVDVTDTKVKENQEKRKKLVEDEQKLANVLRKENWSEGFNLAIELDRPFTLLKIIREIPDVKSLKPIITNLSFDHLTTLTNYIKKWNTNTKTSTEAQIVLNILLESMLPSRLEFLDTVSLLPYTDKHFKRMKKHLEKIAVIKYFEKADK